MRIPTINWSGVIFWLIFFGVAGGIIVCAASFQTLPYSIVIQDATEGQIMMLYDYSGSENRLWIDGAEKIYGDNSLVEITIVVRQNEKDEKIKEAMDYIGITEYVVGEPSRNK